MTTQNGRSGSLNPGEDASPATYVSRGLLVSRLRRICESQPTAWEGETPEGQKVHIAYRFGELSLEVRLPVAGTPGSSTWKTVARFQPALMEAELPSQNGGQDARVQRLMAERSIVSEIRKSNAADMRSRAQGLTGNGFLEVLLDSDRLVISDRQLQRWMQIRNQNLEFLIKRGVAGGFIPVYLQFPGQEKKAE